MWLKIAVPGVIAIVLSLIFFDVVVLGSKFTNFKPFGENKREELKSETEPKQASPSADLKLTRPSQTPTPSPSPTALSSQTPKPSPKPSLKGVTGSITILENNITSPSPSTGGASTISGLIDLSGTIPSNTSVVIAVRKNATSDPFQVVLSGVSATDNAVWTWKNAQNGTVYDMVAILKGSSGGVNTDYAKSQTYVVTAPAYNQIFVLNAGFAMSAPTGAITTTCTTHNSNNTWYATINYPTVTGAQAYWLQAGTTSGATDFVNVKQNAASGDNQKVNVTLTDSVVYYAQYAAASVANPETAQYSGFSSTNSIKCP